MGQCQRRSLRRGRRRRAGNKVAPAAAQVGHHGQDKVAPAAAQVGHHGQATSASPHCRCASSESQPWEVLRIVDHTGKDRVDPFELKIAFPFHIDIYVCKV